MRKSDIYVKIKSHKNEHFYKKLKYAKEGKENAAQQNNNPGFCFTCRGKNESKSGLNARLKINLCEWFFMLRMGTSSQGNLVKITLLPFNKSPCLVSTWKIANLAGLMMSNLNSLELRKRQSSEGVAAIYCNYCRWCIQHTANHLD